MFLCDAEEGQSLMQTLAHTQTCMLYKSCIHADTHKMCRWGKRGERELRKERKGERKERRVC